MSTRFLPLRFPFLARLFALWLLACALPACAQMPGRGAGLPPAVAEALKQAQVPASALSALVVSVAPDAHERLRHLASAPVNPASVMKLVTTYAALDMLGPDFTWNTRFYTDGVVDNGILRGNLYVRGGGDPKLVLERIQEAYLALQAKGVRVILGDMVLDHSAFELPFTDPGAFDGEALRPYNATPDALLVNFKSVILTFVPDVASGVATVISEPPLAGLAIDATVPLSRGACGDWRSTVRARFDDPDAIRFEGRYPQNCGELKWPVAYQQPASYAARAMEGLWRASGGAITGSVRDGTMPAEVVLLHETRSLPLSDVIVDVNRWSNNVMAQQVFLTLGQLAVPQTTMARSVVVAAGSAADRLVPSRPARFEYSREVVTDWWQRTFGRRVPGPVLENGSGLSRDERVTPEALAALLRHAARHPQGMAFVDSLSVVGVNGTAQRLGRGGNSAARGNAYVKTGTLRDVTGIAGYVNALNGSQYVVVAFVNHPSAPAARPALDALLAWTAALPD
ncbi:D-alanyl-D-alanine carboxypeptidase/D-alanyl-D-alanine endopeptidase [Hydrogenophaga sp. BPS33]|uniref:D-alanyl-D-alanine carboxypeptidase/D-alanyl-D-alanine endopeptidase n=1 Tax=Hydrogenophaga sp. BPS33 TaxID=2651974 RepID=UPI00131FBB9A|nr:D-alanyl-D-alanine carboxypeptidase/D-alanyl-D-alanine-endopeptidase [Hydrogenophaga sp. BPS33]QHE88306.1 D-alanyl-D-alanine carboxypeptidase/D-alanyl-D-alanine-endopeptidase [Hydrogenophaga sp. BPS33]